MQITTSSDGEQRGRGIAFTEGRIAGNLQRATGLNPYELGTPEYAEWLRGHQQATAIGLERRIFAARMVA